jgi:hypothetical protein
MTPYFSIISFYYNHLVSRVIGYHIENHCFAGPQYGRSLNDAVDLVS